MSQGWAVDFRFPGVKFASHEEFSIVMWVSQG